MYFFLFFFKRKKRIYQVNVSNGEFLNDNNLSAIINTNNPNENLEQQLQENLNNQPQANQNINNNLDDNLYKEWLLDMVITVNIWHISLLTSFACYLYNVSTLSVIAILSVYDLYDLFFLIRRAKTSL